MLPVSCFLALSDALAVDLVVEALQRLPGQDGWILDGFPANAIQVACWVFCYRAFLES